MARNIQTTTVNLDLSASQAKTALRSLQTEAKRLETALQGAQNSKEAKKLQTELNRVNSMIRRMQTEARTASQVLGNLNQATPKELQRTLATLNRQISNMRQGTEDYIRTAANIRAVRDQLNRVNESMRAQQTLWDRIKSAGYGAVAAVQWGVGRISGAVNFAKEAVEQYAGMEAEMANVRKYSGMTEAEVVQLNEEFKKMDTRSSREQLNQLAQDAGRLGKTSVEDILGFVRAADQINVALDDLGDGATLTLSKLAGLFGIEEKYGTEQGLLKVGSVINELSQNCSAGASFIAQFTARMGATGVQAGITIPQIMAYAAVMDECGVGLEASSTAISQLIIKLFKDPAKFAKAAGLDVKQFYASLQKDANEGFLMLIEALNEKGGLDKLAPIFAEMKISGAEAQKALGLLAQNIDKVKAQQDAANAAFEAGTSITEEFGVQNETVAASLDKARKEIHETTVEIGQQCLPLIEAMTSANSASLKVISSLIGFVIKNRVELLSLVAVVGTYIAVAKIQASWDSIILGLHKAKAVAMATGRAAVLLLVAAYNTLTGNMARASAAMKLFSSTTGMAVSGMGALAAAVMAAVTAIAIYAANTDKLANAQKKVNEVRRDAAERAAEQQAHVETLLKVAQDETASLNARHEAIAKLNKIIPNYNAHLDKTSGKYIANKKALDDYLASLVRFYEAEGARDMIKALAGENAKLKFQKSQAEAELAAIPAPAPSFGGNAGNNISTGGSGSGAVNFQMFTSGNRSGLQIRIRQLENKIGTNEATINQLLKINGEAIVTAQDPTTNDTDTDTGSGPGGGGGIPVDPKEAQEAAREAERARRAAERKAKADFKKGIDAIEAERELRDTASIVSMRDGLIRYSDYRRQLAESEEKMYTDKIRFYQEAGLGDDDDVAELTKKLETARTKYQSEKNALSLKDIKSDEKRAENQAQIDFITPGNEIYRDEQKLQDRLFTIRREALEKTRDLYTEGSRERAEAIEEIELADAEDHLRRQKILAEKLRKYQEEFTTLPIEERKEMELKTLEALHDAELISEEDYQKTRAKIIKKYTKEIKDFKSKEKAEDSPEFTAQNEWAAMAQNMYEAIKGMTDASENDLESWAGRVSALATAVFAVFSAASSSVSALMNANAAHEVAVLSQAYDKKIALAKNNSARQQRLETQKEKAIAAAKAKSARQDFALQVSMAVAQTAVNAIQAYYEGLKVGGIWFAPIAAAMAVAAGAIQIATIKKQQETAVLGYAEGGFTKKGAKDEPAGIVHAGEWVATQALVNNPRTRPLIDILEYARVTNRLPAISAADVLGTTSWPSGAAQRTEAGGPLTTGDGMALNTAAAERLIEAVDELKEVLSLPLTANVSMSGENGVEQGRRRYNQLMKNKRTV